MIILYSPTSTKEEAKKIAKHLLDKNLIACANIFPITSMYHWEGKITEDSEYVLLVKTNQERNDKVEKEIQKLHSYKTPCILTIPANGNKDYMKWLEKEVQE